MAREPGRGWGAVTGLAVVTATLSVVSPTLLIAIPFALLAVALPPRRPAVVAAGALILFAALRGSGGEPLWFVARGWALLLGGWFLLMSAVWPDMRFLHRALTALGGAVASSATFLAFSGDGWQHIDWVVGQHLRGAAAEMITIGSRASAEGWGGELSRSIYRAVELQSMLHPALLGIASLAALAVAWWAFRRLAARDARPLAPLHEFRFNDGLVWVLIAGIALIVLPLGEPAVRAGSNVLLFMGALYMLRGVAVVVAVMGSPGLGSAMLGLIAVFFLPMVMVASVLVGLTDTWLDLRARRSPARPGS